MTKATLMQRCLRLNYLFLLVVPGLAAAADRAYSAPRFSPNKWVEAGPWVGAVTPTSAVVKVRVALEGMSVRLSLGESSGTRTVTFTEKLLAPPSRVLAFPLRNLQPGMHYLYNVEVNGRFDRSSLAQFSTFPLGPASFTFAFASCARTASSHPVFRLIRDTRPMFYMNIGDFHYLNINSPDPEKFYGAYRSEEPTSELQS